MLGVCLSLSINTGVKQAVLIICLNVHCIKCNELETLTNRKPLQIYKIIELSGACLVLVFRCLLLHGHNASRFMDPWNNGCCNAVANGDPTKLNTMPTVPESTLLTKP